MESLSGATTRVAMPEGRIADALSLLKDAYRIHRKLGDRHEMTIDLCRFASVLASVGRVGAATLLLSSAEPTGGDRRRRALGREDERRDAPRDPVATGWGGLRRGLGARPHAGG